MPKAKPPTLRDLRNGVGRSIPPPPLTQKQAAYLAGLSQQTIHAIETGRFKPSPRAMWRLSQAYGVAYELVVAAAEETARQKGKAD